MGMLPLALFTDVAERKVPWSLYCPDPLDCSFSNGQEVTGGGPMTLRDWEHRSGAQKWSTEVGDCGLLGKEFFRLTRVQHDAPEPFTPFPNGR